MKNKFYIFLDIDGVFWDYKWLKKEIDAGRIKRGGLICEFDPKCVDAFNYLIGELNKKYEPVVVISSTYRNNMEKLRQMFLKFEINTKAIKEVVALKTLNFNRDEEIFEFIQENAVENYLIIDDENLNEKKLFKNNNIIKTDIFDSSLSVEKVKSALKNMKKDENVAEM